MKDQRKAKSLMKGDHARYGTFEIQIDFMEGLSLSVLGQIFKDIIIIKAGAGTLYEKRSIKYIAISPLFDKANISSDPVPAYQCIVHQKWSKDIPAEYTFEVEWEKKID